MDSTQGTELRWFTSTRTGGDANCVETARTTGGMAVRDSKDRDGGQLDFSTEGWRTFIAGVKDGEFDL